jgi:hypothetical protein
MLLGSNDLAHQVARYFAKRPRVHARWPGRSVLGWRSVSHMPQLSTQMHTVLMVLAALFGFFAIARTARCAHTVATAVRPASCVVTGTIGLWAAMLVA